MSDIVSNKAEPINERKIELLDELTEYKVDDLVVQFNLLASLVNELVDRPSRDRGPKSKRDITRKDAWRLKFGDLQNMKHKDAAIKLGLSYGQVYSCRLEYTCKDVTADEFSITE